jgi:hypothetical protein
MLCKEQLILKADFILRPAGNLKVFYTDRNKGIRILCISIPLLVRPMTVAPTHSAAFYRVVAKAGVVWGIDDAGGFPAPFTTDGMRAMQFWSSHSRAQTVMSGVEEYHEVAPALIGWDVFCERWIPGLVRDGLMADMNWSRSRATGFDIDSMRTRCCEILILGLPHRWLRTHIAPLARTWGCYSAASMD